MYYAKHDLFWYGRALEAKMSKKQKKGWQKEIKTYLLLSMNGGTVIISDGEPEKGWLRKLLYRYIHGKNQEKSGCVIPSNPPPRSKKTQSKQV